MSLWEGLEAGGDEGTVTKEPTKKETGEKVLTCQNCGETETEVIPVVASTGAPVWLWIVIGVGVAAILLWIPVFF